MSSIGFYFPAAGGSSATPDLQAVTDVGNTTDAGIVIDQNSLVAGNTLGGNAKLAYVDGSQPQDVRTGISANVGANQATLELLGNTADPTDPKTYLHYQFNANFANVFFNNNSPLGSDSTFNFRIDAAKPARDIAFLDEIRDLPVRATAANFAVLLNDYTIEVSATLGTITGTLPSFTATQTRVYVVKLVAKTGAFVCNLTAASLIDGAAIYTLTLLNSAAMIQWNGTTWKVLATKV